MQNSENNQDEIQASVPQAAAEIQGPPQAGSADEGAKKKHKRIRKNLLVLVFILINIAVILYAILGDVTNSDAISFRLLLQMFGQNWIYLVLALAAFAAAVLLRALTNFIILRALASKVNFGLCLTMTAVGGYYDYVTPFGSGGQPFQIYFLGKKGIDSGVAVAAPLAEYSLNRFSFVLLSLVVLVLNGINLFATQPLISSVMLAAAIVGLVLNCAFPGLILLFSLSQSFCRRLIKIVVGLLKWLRISKQPDKLYDKIMSTLERNTASIKLLSGKKRMILGFFISVLVNVALCSIAYFSLKLFGYNTELNLVGEWAHVVILCVLVYNSIAFVPTPGNSGAADLSFYWLFSSALLAGTAAAAMVVWRVFSFYLFIAFGLAFIIADSIKSRKKARIEAALPPQ